MLETNDARPSSSASSRTSIALAPSEIVTATRVSRNIAQASPVLHYRSNSLSQHSSPRMMPSPVPPPCTALPPTPGENAAASPNPSTRRLSHRDNRANSTFAAPSILNRSIRKSYKHSSVGLTQEEHQDLVQKILFDLRPRHFSTSIRSLSRRERPISVASSIHAAARPEMTSKAVEMQHHNSSQSDAAKSGEDALVKMSSSGSKASTPQLSQSRTPTPTTPGSPMARHDSEEEVPLKKDSEGGAMSPSAALESLRVLEQSFDKSACNSPRTGSFDAGDSTSTAVGSSPTKATHDEDQKSASPPSPPRVKRNSSYRKTVPTMDELTSKTGLGIDNHTDSSPSRPNPPTKTEPSSWISSLTTLEAVRVLAFQQDVAEACASPTFPTSLSAVSDIEAATPADEVSALRLALKFTLARADTLADALKRTTEEKIKVETELGILRTNVLSMLGSQNMFGSSIQHGGKGGEVEGGKEAVVEEDEDEFEDARSTRHVEVGGEQAAAAQIVARPAPVVRPSRAKRTLKDGSAASAKASTTAAAAAVSAAKQPSGGVSIASLRTNTSTAPTSVTQRYDPSRKSAHPSNDVSTISSSSSSSSLEDDFEMYPFTSPPPRRAATEVSMTDFLNASRMSKSEILDHDSRRQIEQDEVDHYSISSRSPLNRTPARMASNDYSKRGASGGGKFFGGITKLNRRTARRSSSIMNISNSVAMGLKRSASTSGGSNGFAVQYREESIIPQVRESRSRGKSTTLSLSEALRDSL